MKVVFFTAIFLFSFSLTAFAQTDTDRAKGIEFYQQGEYEKAIGVLQNAVKIEEKDRIAWMYLGASLVKLGRDKEAVKAFKETNVIYEKDLPVYDKKLKIISKKPAPYTEKARKKLTSGNVKVAIEFGADGKIGFVFPFQTLPDGLTENAIAAAGAIKFESAEKDGKPIAVISIVEYNFNINLNRLIIQKDN